MKTIRKVFLVETTQGNFVQDVDYRQDKMDAARIASERYNFDPKEIENCWFVGDKLLTSRKPKMGTYDGFVVTLVHTLNKARKDDFWGVLAKWADSNGYSVIPKEEN